MYDKPERERRFTGEPCLDGAPREIYQWGWEHSCTEGDVGHDAP